ncbi:MAG TPA: hypothetical protein PKH33_14670 [bacterium]|nr:hypothetical protein [bacterium]
MTANKATDCSGLVSAAAYLADTNKYNVECDSISGYDCIAAKKSRFEMGNLESDYPPSIEKEACNDGNSVSVVRMKDIKKPSGRTFVLGNVHPEIGYGSITNWTGCGWRSEPKSCGACRGRAFEEFFRMINNNHGLPANALFTGDFNMDIKTDKKGIVVDDSTNYDCPDEKALYDGINIGKFVKLGFATEWPVKKYLDNIYSNFLEPSGKCDIVNTNFAVFGGPEYDHDAIYCNLKVVNKHNILYQR